MLVPQVYVDSTLVGVQGAESAGKANTYIIDSHYRKHAWCITSLLKRLSGKTKETLIENTSNNGTPCLVLSIKGCIVGKFLRHM